MPAMCREQLSCVVSVSGFRGVIGRTIEPSTVLQLAALFGQAIAQRGPVVLGRDSRPTGAMLGRAAIAGLQGVGCQVIDLGVVPTPTVALMVKRLAAAGGLMVSASHNPVEWNALKCFNAQGRNIDKAELDRLLAAWEEPPYDLWRSWDACGSLRTDESACRIHADLVAGLVDRERIAAAGFTVLVDCVNGAGSNLAPDLLDRLGCRTVPLHANPQRLFPRDPEPTAEKVVQTGALVAAAGAAIGFVQDPDADRLAIIDETGRYIGEEYTLALCAAARLAAARSEGRSTPVVVTNLSTSRMVEDAAAQHQGRVVRTPVAEANVVDGMLLHQAVLGGEGNGGVIDPRLVLVRDSHVAMALVLDLLATSDRPLSQLIAAMPAYVMRKVKVPWNRKQVATVIERIRHHPLAQGAQLDEADGLKLSWSDRWVHLRASGTEPASRIIAEAPTAVAADTLVAEIRQCG